MTTVFDISDNYVKLRLLKKELIYNVIVNILLLIFNLLIYLDLVISSPKLSWIVLVNIIILLHFIRDYIWCHKEINNLLKENFEII